MKKGVRRLIVWLAVLAVLIGGGAVAMHIMGENLEKISALTVVDPDLGAIADGTYNGSYTCLPVAVNVSVTVQDHRITDIAILKHINGQGTAAEALPDTVMAVQSLQVDTVTGATYSSKAILKAIEDALTGE